MDQKSLKRGLNVPHVAAHVTSIESVLSIVAEGLIRPGQPLPVGIIAGELIESNGVRLKLFQDNLPSDLKDILLEERQATNQEAWCWLQEFGIFKGIWTYFKSELDLSHDESERQMLASLADVSDLEEARRFYQWVLSGKRDFGSLNEKALYNLSQASQRKGVVFLWGVNVIKENLPNIMPDDQLEGAIHVVTETGLPLDQSISLVPLGRVERSILRAVGSVKCYHAGTSRSRNNQAGFTKKNYWIRS